MKCGGKMWGGQGWSRNAASQNALTLTQPVSLLLLLLLHIKRCFVFYTLLLPFKAQEHGFQEDFFFMGLFLSIIYDEVGEITKNETWRSCFAYFLILCYAQGDNRIRIFFKTLSLNVKIIC